MFIELTWVNLNRPDLLPAKITINVDSIRTVADTANYTTISFRDQNARTMAVTESYDEVRKRLGLAISPRAETLAQGVVG